MVSAPSRTSKACTEWQISTIVVSGTILRRTPLMVPMKWSLRPKSVVRVIRRGWATAPSVNYKLCRNGESNGSREASQGTEVMVKRLSLDEQTNTPLFQRSPKLCAAEAYGYGRRNPGERYVPALQERELWREVLGRPRHPFGRALTRTPFPANRIPHSIFQIACLLGQIAGLLGKSVSNVAGLFGNAIPHFLARCRRKQNSETYPYTQAKQEGAGLRSPALFAAKRVREAIETISRILEFLPRRVRPVPNPAFDFACIFLAPVGLDQSEACA